MTGDVQFLRVEKRASSNIITIAAQHNLRKLGLAHGPNIDLRLSVSNRVLRGPDTVDGIVGMASALMQEARVKLAKNTVRMVELLVSLPASTTVDQAAYFEQAAQWVEGYFPIPMLSAVLHLDEQNPHVHFLLLPLVDGRMKGSDLVGGPAQIRAMHDDFYEQVAKHHGLTRKGPEKRLSAAVRGFAADAIIEALQSNPALLNDPDMVAAMRAAFGETPEPALKALRIEMPKPVRKPKRKAASSFVAQMTRPVKPDRINHMVSDDSDHTELVPAPAGTPPKKSKPYLCGGFAIDRAIFQGDDRHHADAGNDVERVLSGEQERKLNDPLLPSHGRRRLSPSSSSLPFSKKTGLRAVQPAEPDRAGRKQ